MVVEKHRKIKIVEQANADPEAKTNQ
jgi:hypothetical protein